MSPFFGGAQTNSVSFDPTVAFVEYLKRIPDEFEKYTIEHMRLNETSLYESSVNDEFIFEEKVAEHQARLKDSLQERSTTLFHIFMDAEFGKYDFKEKAFAFQPLQANSYFKLKRKNFRCSQCETYTQIDLFFNNTSDFQYMPMDKDSAKAFIGVRKDNNGRIDRGVQVKIVFDISEVKKTEKSSNVVEANLYGNIRQMEIIDNPRHGKKTNKTLVKLVPE